MSFSRVNLKFKILFTPLRSKRGMKSLAPSLMDKVLLDISPAGYGAIMLKVILNHPCLFAGYECQLINGGDGIHIVSENHSEALGINNRIASYWPHLLSFSAGCFHS